MITKQKHVKKELPFIPNGAEYMLDHIFVKEVDGILHTWQPSYRGGKNDGNWVNTGKTLSEYNDYQALEAHELQLHQILNVVFKDYIYTRSSFGKFYGEKYYIFKNWDEEFYVSYYKPKAKGFKGDKKRTRYGAGETIKLDKTKFPQLEVLVGDEIVIDSPRSGC